MPGKWLARFWQLLEISNSHDIARRYFVVNGFDGALTMLGIVMGFYVSKTTDQHIIITTCLSAAIALTMSGFSSAYISETAERKKEFLELKKAMVAKMHQSTHRQVPRTVPVYIAIVNGLAPLFFSLLIISPFLLTRAGMRLPFDEFVMTFTIALLLIFSLGAYLGKVSGSFWLITAVQTLLVALLTTAIIFALS